MALSCCDIPAYLSSIPTQWKEQITSLLCTFITEQATPELDCQKVAECETLTSISDIDLSEDFILSFTYNDEHGESNYKSIDLTDLLTAATTNYTFQNGVGEITSGVVELGVNPLSHNTTLNLSTYELAIAGTNLKFSSFPNSRDDSGTTAVSNLLYTNGSGLLLSAPVSEITDLLTFNNGMTRSVNNTQLGGALIQTTNLSANYDMAIQDGRFGVGYTAPFTASIFKFGVSNSSTSIYNSGSIINSQPMQNTNNTSALVVSRSLTGGAYIQSASANSYGIYSSLDLLQTGNQTFLDSNTSSIKGMLALNATGATFTSPMLSAINAGVNAVNTGVYSKVSGVYIPRISAVVGAYSSYTGTITEYNSIYIDTLGRTKTLGASGVLTKTYGIHQIGDVSNLLEGQVTITNGTTDPEDSAFIANYPLAGDRPRLVVTKGAIWSTSPIQVASSTDLVMSGAGSDSSTALYAGVAGTLFFSYSTNQTLRASTRMAGVVGGLSINSNANHTVGIPSGLSTNIVLASTSGTNGSMQNLAGLRVSYPQQSAYDAGLGRYFGGITNAYGIYIDNQRLDSDINAITTNSWGIYQNGASDNNYYAGSVNIGTTSVSTKLLLQLSSSTKGSLPAPSMTTTERNALGVVPGGTLIYNSTTEQYEYYKTSTTSWLPLNRLKGYTVATLPAGVLGDRAYITDGTTPTYNGALVGGGAIKVPVFFNGVAWISA